MMNSKIPHLKLWSSQRQSKKKLKLYKVILLNDDYTPMGYVVALLREVFKKSESEAVNINGT